MKIPLWIIYGMVAALFFGGYAIASKVATSKKYFGVSPEWVSLFLLIGMAIVFVGNIIIERTKLPESKAGIGFAILAGILVAIGISLCLRAMYIGADISRLVPLFNTNTLVAVILGIILLHELPQAGEAIKVVIGAILIVVGAILVSI